MWNKKTFAVLAVGFAAASAVCAWVLVTARPVEASYRFADFEGHPPIHIRTSGAKTPSGVTPAEIKKVYKLPATGGKGTVAIVDAYDDATIENDLAVFDAQYKLPACTTKNGCFEKHKMATSTAANKASTSTLKFFRDITSGSNGTCKYYCDARARYDYVTGLGTPQTDIF